MSRTRITSDEVAKHLRTPGSSLAITGSVYPKQGGTFAGEGTIQRTERAFVVRLTFSLGAEVPEMKGGMLSRKDFWRFEGMIGADLPLIVEDLVPSGRGNWSNGITSQEYDAHTIALSPSGLDKLSVSQLSAVLGNLQSVVNESEEKSPEGFALEADETKSAPANANSGAGEMKDSKSRMSEANPERAPELASDTAPQAEKPSPYANGTWIHALVPEFPLIHSNGNTEIIERNVFLGESKQITRDTYSDSFEGVQFALVRRGEDLNAYLFLPAETDATTPVETHERFLTAFLTGLAFATGQHCWPYRVTIRRNGALLSDKLNAVGKLNRTALSPFSERIGFNAAVGQVDWDFGSFLGQATQFFNSGSELSRVASQALWLLRSSDAENVPGEITLMSLCVLLESFAGMIFDERKLSSTQDATSFEAARRELLKWIEEKKPKDGSGLQRFQNMIASARLDRAKDKYKAVSDHFGLQWEGLMKDAWSIWEKVRNKGAHDILRKEKEDKVASHFTAIGRIAGAINVLVLRLIGYSGIARTSVFEDKHHKI